MSSDGIIHVSSALLVSPECLEKTYIDFSNNTFPIDAVSYTYINIYGEFDLFMKILNFNGRFEI